MANTTRLLSAPTSVTLMITRRCNLRCLHCGSSGEQILREDMSTQEILGVLDELTRCKVFHVSISGGEPLLHPDFFVIVDGIMQRPLRWQLDTNATLVTEDIAERLQKLPHRPFLSVSLDGMTVQTQEHIRGPGSYGNTLTGIIRLTAAGLRVRPFTVLSRVNYRELPQIVAFIKSMGIKNLNVTPPSSCGRAGQHAREMALRGEELREALELSLQIEANHPQLFTGPWVHMLGLYRSMKAGEVTAQKGANGVYKNCGAAQNSCTIASDGTVVPCDMSYTYRAGNVRDQPLAEIWRHSVVFRNIRESRGMPLSQVHGCEDCAWHHACQGPCPAGGYALTGLWPAAEPTCTAREIGRLFDTETVAPVNGKVS